MLPSNSARRHEVSRERDKKQLEKQSGCPSSGPPSELTSGSDLSFQAGQFNVNYVAQSFLSVIGDAHRAYTVAVIE